MRRDSGSASIQTLVVLSLIAIVSGAAGYAVMSAGKVAARRTLADMSPALLETANSIMAGISSDATPGSDSAFDPAFSLAEKAGATLSDASSRVNPNWIRKKMLDDTAMSSFLKNGADSQLLQQSRMEEGLATDIASRYTAFFTDEAIEASMTGFSYANVNSADEFALERLFLEASGDAPAASSFHSAVRSALIDKRLFASGDLISLFGRYRESLGTIMTVEPQINVNFVDRSILEALLSYPAYEYRSPSSGADAIVSARSQGELTMERAAAILGLEKGHALFSYLGDDTWFWRVSIPADDGTFEAVYARAVPVPGEPAPTETEKGPKLVSWRFVR